MVFESEKNSTCLEVDNCPFLTFFQLLPWLAEKHEGDLAISEPVKCVKQSSLACFFKILTCHRSWFIVFLWYKCFFFCCQIYLTNFLVGKCLQIFLAFLGDAWIRIQSETSRMSFLALTAPSSHSKQKTQDRFAFPTLK